METLEGIFDIAWHGDIDVALVIVPVKLESTELGASPFSGDGVFRPQRGFQVFGMFCSNILDSEVVHDEAERDGACFVAEETWNAL